MSDDDEEPLEPGPVVPDVLLESLETVEASVVRLDDEANDETEQETGAEESESDNEDIPSVPMEESLPPKKRGRASVAAANPKAAPKAKATTGRKRKADELVDDPATKRSGRGRATAAAASSAIKQDLAKRSRAPNGQGKAVRAHKHLRPSGISLFANNFHPRSQAPKKAAGAKRGPKPKAAQPKEQEFEVERIDDHKVNGKTTMFYVKWKGYSAEENTWEPKSNMAHAADLLQEYEAAAKEDKAVPTPEKAATPKKASAQKQKAGPKPKKVTSKKTAAQPAGRTSGRPKRH